MHLVLTKSMVGFIPADHETNEFYEKLKLGKSVHGDFKQMRNAAFHRKGMALFRLGFDSWEPGEINSQYGTPQKNFDRFRKDVTILAGFYHLVIRIDGSTRVEADSLKFGSMDDDTFQKVYSAVIDVMLEKITAFKDMTRDEVNDLTDKFLQFA